MLPIILWGFALFQTLNISMAANEAVSFIHFEMFYGYILSICLK